MDTDTDTDTDPGTRDARPRDRFPVLPSFPGPASGPGPGDGGAPPHVVVVGGGIAGLTAAARLSGAVGEAGARARVTLLEAGDRLGGKLLRGEVGGVPVDLGAEAMGAARPEGVALAREAGLGHEVEPPTTARASLWSRGVLRALPGCQVGGVPGDLDALAVSGVLSPGGLLRAGRERRLPPTEVGDDIAVGRYVAARLGREVVERLVEPVLGAVHAGHPDRLSLRAALPRLLPVAHAGLPLVEGVRRLCPDPAPVGYGVAGHAVTPPPYRSIRGGLGRLPLAVARGCRSAGADIRTGTTVRSLRRTGQGWRLTLRRGGAEYQLAADAVVLAVPAPVAAGLLAAEVPAAAADLRTVAYADTAVVTLVYPRARLSGALRGSGFLVPAVDGHLLRAATFVTGKWRWPGAYAPDKVVVRASVGRYGENSVRTLDDAELLARARTELAAATGLTAPPCDTAVTRWTAGLPQYTVGHVARMARFREHLAQRGTLAVCGAAYDGAGVTECVAGARRAADSVATALEAGARRC